MIIVDRLWGKMYDDRQNIALHSPSLPTFEFHGKTIFSIWASHERKREDILNRSIWDERRIR